jgi:hypothetical protein
VLRVYRFHRRSLSALAALLAGVASADSYAAGYLDADDPDIIDAESSLEYRYSEENRATVDGDLRGGYFNSSVDLRDGGSNDTDDYSLRFRYGVNFGFTNHARLKARLAATCSDSECDPKLDVSSRPANGSNIDDGDIVLDEFYLDFFERGRFDLALGRMQTRSVTRGGVFISSLTRLTSPNVAVNWTDGAALRYITDSGWNSNLILQYNDDGGSSTLARTPLDFDDDDSRYSWFYSLESREPWGPFTQRAFDITWMPSALLQEGNREGNIEDYWNLVGRFATRWPAEPSGPSVIVSGELGYAPETPSEQALSTGDSGDSNGIAWHLEASWMDFRPGHSIGINYGYTDPGWLLSPSYRPNEETFTLRYHWRPRSRVQLEIQARWRDENEQLQDTLRKRETFDWRVRLTWALASRSSRLFR